MTEIGGLSMARNLRGGFLVIQMTNDQGDERMEEREGSPQDFYIPTFVMSQDIVQISALPKSKQQVHVYKSRV
jgi:hypothetical protein